MKTWRIAGRLLLAMIALTGAFWRTNGEHARAAPCLAATVVVSVEPPAGTVAVGERFTTTIEIEALVTPLAAFQFDLAYDPAITPAFRRRERSSSYSRSSC